MKNINVAGINKLLGDNLESVSLFKTIPLLDCSMITIVDMDSSLKQGNSLKDKIKEVYPDIEVYCGTGSVKEGDPQSTFLRKYIKLDMSPSGVENKAVFISDLSLLINESNKIIALRNVHLPTGIEFTL